MTDPPESREGSAGRRKFGRFWPFGCASAKRVAWGFAAQINPTEDLPGEGSRRAGNVCFQNEGTRCVNIFSLSP
jgi:hypothetical protein